jgi:hypothetical protein
VVAAFATSALDRKRRAGFITEATEVLTEDTEYVILVLRVLCAILRGLRVKTRLVAAAATSALDQKPRAGSSQRPTEMLTEDTGPKGSDK